MNNTSTLSKITVTENGIISSPGSGGNKAVSLKKQRSQIVEAFRDNLISINDSIQDIDTLKADIKNLSARIRISKEAKELARMRKALKEISCNLDQLKSARMGMLQLAKKLGFDPKQELKNLKMIEA